MTKSPAWSVGGSRRGSNNTNNSNIGNGQSLLSPSLDFTLSYPLCLIAIQHQIHFLALPLMRDPWSIQWNLNSNLSPNLNLNLKCAAHFASASQFFCSSLDLHHFLCSGNGDGRNEKDIKQSHRGRGESQNCWLTSFSLPPLDWLTFASLTNNLKTRIRQLIIMKTSPKSRPDEFGSYFIYIQSKKPFEHQSMGVFFNIFFPLSSASIYLSIRFVRSGLFTRCQLSETVRCIHPSACA